MDRTASISRTTSETDIAVTLNLDGSGRSDIDTGIGFFDHMLRSFAKHGFFDLTVHVKGDLEVDCHHTIEDTGIVLGEAIKKALDDKKGIRRYGSFALPMDETLVLTALDLSGPRRCPKWRDNQNGWNTPGRPQIRFSAKCIPSVSPLSDDISSDTSPRGVWTS